jgi:four helix bundle protein
MNNFKELKIWHKSVELAVKVYQETQQFPKEEVYGLTSQIRKSVVSVASNIAEGAGRNSKRDFYNFLGISNGSICELETQLIIAERVNFLNETVLSSLQEQIVEIQKMNWSLKKSLVGTKD